MRMVLAAFMILMQFSCSPSDSDLKEERQEQVQQLLQDGKPSEAMRVLESVAVDSLSDEERVLYAELILYQAGVFRTEEIPMIKEVGRVDWRLNVANLPSDPFIGAFIPFFPPIQNQGMPQHPWTPGQLQELKLIWTLELFFAHFGPSSPMNWPQLERAQNVIKGVAQTQALMISAYIQILFSKGRIELELSQRLVTRQAATCQFQMIQKTQSFNLIVAEWIKVLYSYQLFAHEDETIFNLKVTDLRGIAAGPNEGILPYSSSASPPSAPSEFSEVYQAFVVMNPVWFCR